MFVTRRSLLVAAPAGWLWPPTEAAMTGAQAPATATAPAIPAATGAARAVSDSFPAHNPALARDMVGASHGNVARVRELLTAHPTLALATWDWGYGDWETALGAASHVGNREIAELLLANGAAPTLFSAAMLGQLEVVQALVKASPGVQRTRGPHGITLLAHARAGGQAAAPVLTYLESLGDADLRYQTQPITEADQKAVAGRYTFGSTPADAFTVAVGSRGLGLRRENGSPRDLFHLGAREFHPAGAPAVRVRFTGVADRATTLTIVDGPITITAVRAD